MGKLKPGTPVKTANSLVFNQHTKKPGVEGLVVKKLDGDGGSGLAYYDVLFPGEATVKTLVYPGEFEVDMEKLPLVETDISAMDVRLGTVLLGDEGKPFVVDNISQSVQYEDVGPPKLSSEGRFSGFLVEQKDDNGYRGMQVVEDINTYTVVALVRPSV